MNELVENYIVNEMRPLSTVEKPSFISLMEGLSSHKPETRKTLSKKLDEKRKKIRQNLMKLLKGQHDVCTTADIWSVNQKSYLGSTVHFLSNEDFSRQSYLLAIKILKFSHTYDEIGLTLWQINTDFEIVEKIIATVTDNASNFAKSFREYSNTDDTDHTSAVESHSDIEESDIELEIEQICMEQCEEVFISTFNK